MSKLTIGKALMAVGFGLVFSAAILIPAARCWHDGGLPVLSILHVGCAIPYSLIHNPSAPELSP